MHKEQTVITIPRELIKKTIVKLPRPVMTLIDTLSNYIKDVRKYIFPANKRYPQEPSKHRQYRAVMAYLFKNEFKSKYKQKIYAKTRNKTSQLKTKARENYSEEVTASAFALGTGNCDILAEVIMYVVKSMHFNTENIRSATIEIHKNAAAIHVFNLLIIEDEQGKFYKFNIDAWIGETRFSSAIAQEEASLYLSEGEKYTKDRYIINLKNAQGQFFSIEELKNHLKKNQYEIWALAKKFSNDIKGKVDEAPDAFPQHQLFPHTSIFKTGKEETYYSQDDQEDSLSSHNPNPNF